MTLSTAVRGPVPAARGRLRRAMALVLAALLSCGVVALVAAPPATAETVPPGFTVASELTGTGTIIEVAHAPDGRRFLAEKGGRVKVLHPDGRVTMMLDLRNRVNSYSDRGLLGMAVDDQFATNGWLYLLFSQELNTASPDGSGPMTSALTRVSVRPDSTVADPTSPGTYILGSQGQQPCPTPADTLDCMPSDHYWHSIGTVRVDPTDGTLWVGSGDAHVTAIDGTSYQTYNETSTAGKILHIDKNGRGLPGHPFCPEVTDLTRTCTKVYAEGFRNPYRFTLRPGKGPVVGDVGLSTWEEVNLVQPGRNYGWPCYEGPNRHALHQSTPTCQALYAQEGTAAGATPPAWSYAHGSGAAVVAGPVYSGSSYPADMQGDIFVGDYVQGWVRRLEVDAQDRVTAVHDFAQEWTGVSLFESPTTRDIGYVDMGWASDQPALRTYTYGGAANAPPVAVAAATPTSGTAPLTVTFSSAGSNDPEGGALSYEWDFGDGSARDTTANPTHVYAADGSYTATLTVLDPQGGRATATAAVTVGSNAPPSASVDAPIVDSLYSNGVRVDLAGSATDPEDGQLDGSRLSWQVLLHHGTHLHELATSTGSTSSFVPVTDHDADSFYEIRLTATDSAGATATAVRTIRPRTVEVTLASSPAGIPLSYDGQAAPAPSTRTSAVGYRATVEAPASHVLNGVTYTFAGWSDGGAAGHTIDVPATATTLTAQYTTGTPPTSQVLSFNPTADTYVDANAPTTNQGTRSALRADASPEQWSLTRFQVAGLAGGTVTKVVLRFYETDNSNSGGRVRTVSGAWSENTTYSTRPTLGAVIATVGPVAAGNWYEIELPATAVTADGVVEFGLDSLSSDGHVFASRSTATPPQLLVTVSSEQQPPPPPAPQVLSFTPTADTYVDAGAPTTTQGTRSGLRADASPEQWSLTRFQVSGLGDRFVTKVVLRFYETDSSNSGGRVRTVSGAWSENTTYSTRPTLGTVLATVGPVARGNWYEIELPASAITADGVVEFGLDSLSSDGHVFASRSTATPPQLLVTVSPEPAPPPPPPPPPPPTEVLSFGATADTYVDSGAPTTSQGTRSGLRADASPEQWALTRFEVAGLGGRTVTKVVLRFYETDNSNSGGRVRTVSGAWSETTTYDTRPTLGTVLASVGPVASGNWYEIEIPASAITADGVVEFGLDSLSSDGHVFASRSTATPPQLLVTVANPAP